jgi:zinc ribbon protein
LALISCPECQREISDEAVQCPHCGRPMAASRAHPTPRFGPKHPGRILGWALVVAIGGCVAFELLGREPDSSQWPMSTTAIRIDPRCQPEVIQRLDALNATALTRGKAKMTSAVCGANGGLRSVKIRADDGGMLSWNGTEGTDELARRLYYGR